MILLTVQTEKHNIPLNIIYLNAVTLNKLNLPIYKPLNLIFGNKKMVVRIGIGSHKGSLIRVPEPIANYLMLPNGVQLNASYKNNELKLGPTLGILVQSIQANQVKSPFGKFTAFAEEVSRTGLSKGVLPYFFTINDINEEEGQITGFFFRNGKWEKRTFPFPNAIYNRISSRNLETKLHPTITKLTNNFKFVFFNDRFLNKWEVAQILKPTPIKMLIPKTVQYRNLNTIKEMLDAYPVIYLKPTDGALGNGIIKIERQSGGYTVQYTRIQGSATLTFKSITKMFNYLNLRLSARNYLVQQGLNLITFNKRPVDFRILVQKNEYGKWAVTSMVARIASDNHFVSNIAQGGTQTTIIEALKGSNPNLSKKFSRKHFRENALLIAKYLEKGVNGHFAELGIDLALDDKGKMWLIEVNSKPSKIDELRESKDPRPSVNKLIKYVLFVLWKKK